jgi:hypothetical protein
MNHFPEALACQRGIPRRLPRNPVVTQKRPPPAPYDQSTTPARKTIQPSHVHALGDDSFREPRPGPKPA